MKAKNWGRGIFPPSITGRVSKIDIFPLNLEENETESALYVWLWGRKAIANYGEIGDKDTKRHKVVITRIVSLDLANVGWCLNNFLW